VRKRVATALFSVRTGEARAVLASLVSDEESDVRNEVADAIKRHPWPEAAGALLASARAGAPLSQQVAEALAASAATAGPGERTEAASLLLTQAGGKRDRHHHHALYALTALVKHGGAFPTVGAAAERFASHEDLRVRVAGLALQVAADVERAASFAKLLELAAKGSTDESASADVQLRNLPAPLVAAMRGGDPIVRARAASLAVGTIFLARESSLDSLLALTKDGDDGVREAAVMALARCLPAGKPFFVDRKELIAPALSALSSDSATKVTDAVAKAQRVLGVA
jgi:HEAT repeat protein